MTLAPHELDPYEDFQGGATDWDCNWEDDDCPSCGHPLDKHDIRTMTRCASAAFTVTRSTE